jgi:hypothetical protein
LIVVEQIKPGRSSRERKSNAKRANERETGFPQAASGEKLVAAWLILIRVVVPSRGHRGWQRRVKVDELPRLVSGMVGAGIIILLPTDGLFEVRH